MLQAAEFDGRQRPASKPSLHILQGYELMVVPGENGKDIWIMLNPKSPPYYKQLPAGQFKVPKTFIEELIKQRKLGYTVEQVLVTSAASQ